jgi:nitrate/nitrite transporter NarK
MDSGYWPLWFFTVVFTLLDASFPIVWATVGDFFGRRNFATIRGMMSFFYGWGSFAGPVLAGWIFDQTQSYRMVLWIWLYLLILATLLVLFLIRPWNVRMDAVNSSPSPQ